MPMPIMEKSDIVTRELGKKVVLDLIEPMHEEM